MKGNLFNSLALALSTLALGFALGTSYRAETCKCENKSQCTCEKSECKCINCADFNHRR